MIVVGILGSGSVMPAEVARRAATGARTEIVGVAPIGAIGDRLLAELAQAGVGHATVTRSSASAIEPADLDLALRYLPDIRAVVLVAPAAPLVSTAIGAASWSGASLVLVGPLDADAIALVDAASVPPVVLEPPDRDPDGAFAGLVAALGTRLDSGEDPASAWQSTVATLAVDSA